MVDFGFDAVIAGYGNPTSLEFVKGANGEDLLVTSQQDGTLTVWNVTSTGSGEDKDFSATQVFETDIVKTILNHDDDGSLNLGETDRQVTGFKALVDENGDIQIYVTSSDPRIGGGGESSVDDKGLDTNSGVLSKVTVEVPADASVPDAGWSAEKIDLLRGIPRSEENHSVNGLEFTPEGKLLVAVGGFTNTGAPSQNLVYTPEYFLSASIIEVDVAAIEAMDTKTDSEGQEYKYDLPTLGIERLDHESRNAGVDGVGFSSNADNPFGGNDGYNQTYLEPGGPVSLFATGFRNTYDIEIVVLEPGDSGYVEPTPENPNPDNFRVYTWDNGANNGWGDPPLDADGNPVTEANADQATNYPVVEDNTPVSPGAQDQLHLVERGGYYGSPNPSRVNPDTPLYLKPEIETGANNFGEIAPEFIVDPSLPASGDNVLGLWAFLPEGVDDPLNGYAVDPLEGHYLKPVTGGNSSDGTLVLNNGSTNGIFIFEYDPAIHPASMAEFDGNLFATGFDEQILRVEFNEDGTTALNRVDIEINDNAWQSSPGSNPLDTAVGPGGSIWVAAHGGNNIFAFIPEGIPIEETDNDDNDDLLDNLDPFQLDAENGLGENSKVDPGEIFEFTMETELPTPNGLQGFALGFTGHMVNYDTEFFTNSSGVVKGGILEGGIAGKLQIEFDAVGDGTAVGSDNSATYALQAGVNFDDVSDKIILESTMSNPWSGAAPQPGQSMGIQFGTGTQFDFAMFNFGVNALGEAEVQVTIELNDVAVVTETIAAPGLLDGIDSDMVMRVVIDRDAGTVTPSWEYETNGGIVTGSTSPISLDTDNNPATLNNLEEALFGAANGGFLAREKPGTPGEQGGFLFGDFTDGFGVPLGLAVGINGRVDTLGSDPGGTSFAPEFDNLLVAASDANGNFAPVTKGEDAGSVELNQTLTIDPAALLANDRDLDGGTLSIVEVKDATGGSVQLVDGMIEFTATGLLSAGFTYVVSDGTTTTDEQAVVTVTPPGGAGVVLYRVNAGGAEVAALDGGPNWEADVKDTNPSQYLTSDGTNSTFSGGATNEAAEILVAGESGLSNVDGTVVPEAIFFNERSDNTADGDILEYSFAVDPSGTYLVNIYYTENWDGIVGSGPRQFDVSVNGVIPAEFEDINPYEESGSQLGVALKRSFFVTQQNDPVLNLGFLHNDPAIQNPKINGIEIVALAAQEVPPAASVGDVVVTEGGDLLFAVTLDKAVPSDAVDPVTITYEIVPGSAQPGVDYQVAGEIPDINGVITGSVTVAKGSSDQSIVVQSIGNDLLDGTREFTVNLTGITLGDATIADGQALGTIEDDEVGTVEKGAVLLAVNVAGPEVTATDGVVYQADDPADWTGSTTYFDGKGGPDEALVDGDYDGDGDTDNDDVLYATERFGGAPGDAPMVYTTDGLPEGDAILTLKLAEIYDPAATTGVGARVFNVTVNGVLVLENVDLLATGALHEAQDFDVPVSIAADGILTISMSASADNAALKAFALYDAETVIADTTAPSAAISFGPLVTDKDPIVVTVVFSDNEAFDDATVGAADLSLNGPSTPAGVNFSYDAESNTATYSFAAPASGWTDGDYTATLAAGSVADAAGNGIAETSSTPLAIAGLPGSILAIADAAETVESGDNGATSLAFGLTASGEFTGDLTLNITIDGAPEQRLVSFAAGLGVLTVDVPNDNEDNGTESVSVTLVSVVESDFAVDAAAATASGDVTEDDVFDPLDIDSDGIANTDDPFAFDGSNGDDKQLLPGGSFVQDFNSDTTDPFSAEAGFSGVIVNQAFDPASSSATDPYGDRTTESGVSVSGGVLNVTSSGEDLFGTGTDANNVVKDNYQSAADVTGIDVFEVEAKASNPFFGTTGPTSFASFGITLGAGGVDDYIKFVLGGSGDGPRIQLAQEASLTGDKEENEPLADLAVPIDPALVKDVIFNLTVDKLAGTVLGTATLLGEGGGELGSVQTALRTIDPAGSFAAALDGMNPLTGGDGGIAYGISITDFGGAPAFTGSWDSLAINAIAPLPNFDPTVSSEIADQVTAEEAAFSFTLPEDTFADANVEDVLTLTATLADGSPLPAWLLFDGTTFSGTPDDPDVGVVTVRVTADDSRGGTVFDDFDLEVTPVNDAPSAVTLENLLPALPEDTDTSVPIKVADIVVIDDGLGTNVLGLTGEDAGLFEIVGTELFLKAGVVLDLANNPTLDIAVTAQDDGFGPAVSVPLALAVEATGPVTIQAEDLLPAAIGETTFFAENSSAAEGNKVIRLPSGTADNLTVDLADFDIKPGSYTLQISYFDENDGASSAFVTVGGETFGWTWDEATSSSIASVTNKRIQQFDITIPEGQTSFTLGGVVDGGEPLRIDSITLIPVEEGGSDNLAPVEVPGILIDLAATQSEAVLLDLSSAFVDPEETALTFELVSGPVWLSLDANGLLSGTPEQADITTEPAIVEFTVTDAQGASTPASFAVTVDDINDAPTVVGNVEDQEGQVGQDFSFVLPEGLFEDIDEGDVLTMAVEGLPAGLTFDPETNTISGQPAGPGTSSVTVTATDGDGESAQMVFNIDVFGIGPSSDPVRIQAEEFDSLSGFFIEGQGAAEGEAVIRLQSNQTGEAQLDLTGRDVDAGTYAITISYFDENDGQSSAEVLVDGQPVGAWNFDNDGPGNAAQAANLRSITFDGVQLNADSKITINGSSDATEFVRIDYIELTPAGGGSGNFGPQVALPIADMTVDQSSDVTISLLSAFSDPEEDPLTYSVSGADWLSVDGGALVGQPPLPGDYLVTVTATDETGSGAQKSQTFLITVDPIPAEVSVADVVVNESDGTAEVVFTRTGDPSKDITVSYSVSDGSANAGSDFTPPLVLTAVILAGEFSATASFAITDDLDVEGDEDFSITIDGAADIDGVVAVNAAAATASVTITDNDIPTLIAIADAGEVVESGGIGSDTILPFAVTTDTAFSGDLTLTYSLDGGTTETTQLVTFTDGVGSLAVAVGNDDADNGPDVIEVTLTGVDDTQFAIDGAAAVGNGTVTEDDVGADPNVILLNFSTPTNDPLSAGFDGLTQSPDPSFVSEETGTAVVSDGALRIQTTTGDAGGEDTAQDNYFVSIDHSDDLAVETKIANPWFGLASPPNFSQLGLNISLDQDQYLKFTFGSPGAPLEFSFENDGAQAKETADLPVGVTIGQIKDVVLTIDVTVSGGQASAVGVAKFLDENGAQLGGDVVTPVQTLDGVLEAALVTPGVSYGVGVTQTNIGSGPSFEAAYDYIKITKQGETAGDPSDVIAILEQQDDVVTDTVYADGTVGSAVLRIMEGNNDIEASNFGANSFQVENTGDKKISAVFIDVRGALYDDSVFDPDGQGGDSAAKAWAVNNDGGTGGFVDGSGYFLPGADPLDNTTGTGNASNGGFEGALVKFNASVDGGFEKGEIVGFSGDMDPNSIAGLAKGGASGVDTSATLGWDVGGVSGAELIGSRFIVLFDDGTTASGELHSDGSQAGSQALATQGGPAPKLASLSVNGVLDGGAGTYGAVLPTVIVTGEVGDTVRVVLTKGFNPVTNDSSGVAALVAARLSDAHPDFEANNAADFQIIDVVIPEGGSLDISNLFDYDDLAGSGESEFPGSDVLPIGFAAAVIDPSNEDLPLGPVSQPIYLENVGGPVVGDPPPSISGFFEMIGTGNAARFKVQFEDPNGPGGTDPGGDWTYADSEDGAGNQSNFQGSGYYFWGSESGSTALNGPQPDSFLEYQIFIPEGEGGAFTLRVRSARDTSDPGDARNDIWVKINDDAEGLLVSDVNAVSNAGFIKLFGNATGDFGFSTQIDSVSDEEPNFTAVFDLEPGFHTITFAGRSEGYHVDFFELYKGGAPAAGSTDSPFIPLGDTAPFVANPIGDQTVAADGEFSFVVPSATFNDLDGDALTYLPPTLPPGLSFDTTTGTFSGLPDAGEGTYTIEISVQDDDSNTATVEFDLTVGEVVVPGETVRLEAETFSLSGFAPDTADPSSTPIIKLVSGSDSGTASISLQDVAAGTYTVKLLAYDENDGAGSGSVTVGSTTLNFTLDGSLPGQGNAGQAANRVELDLGQVAVSNGDTLQLTYGNGDGELGRFDYVELVPVGSGSGGGGDPTGSVVWTAKSAADDVEEAGSLASPTLEFGENGQAVSVRFTGEGIPAGAVITSAYLEFEATANKGGAIDLEIFLEDSLDAAAYTSGGQAAGRAVTSNSGVAWDDLPTWQAGETYQTPDLSGLLNDLIQNGGLGADDALGFRIERTNGSDGTEREAFAAATGGAEPKLVIEYSDPSAASFASAALSTVQSAGFVAQTEDNPAEGGPEQAGDNGNGEGTGDTEPQSADPGSEAANNAFETDSFVFRSDIDSGRRSDSDWGDMVDAWMNRDSGLAELRAFIRQAEDDDSIPSDGQDPTQSDDAEGNQLQTDDFRFLA